MGKSPKTILIVDDEASQRALLGGFVESLGFRAVQAASAEEALEIVARDPPQMILLDVRLPGMSGIDALGEIHRTAGDLRVLLITAHADLRQAVAAMKKGADDYLSKPIDLDELAVVITDTIGTATGRRPPELGTGQRKVPELPDGLICESRAMRRLVETVAIVAEADAPVLITGESGVGKEVVAHLVHGWSPRNAGPLVAANCAGLPESLIESELFGHTKGAFTGAEESRRGLFRAAHGGTLFLDEIGELPLHLQPKLLRALESKQITPVGGDQPLEVDVRLVAATNRDLGAAVTEGQFRDDLYYRIDVVELDVPPLRRRRDDILPMARLFAGEFAGRRVRLSPQTVQCLLSHSWPGNVRQLRNAVQRACLLCRGDVILPEHLPPKIAGPATPGTQEPDDGGRLSQVERATILATLAECHDNRTQTAKKLGISRRALIYKLRAIESEGL
ncbi:MAG: sigma-54-dependent Fis family transcriptional regulator [Planctomycetes bacterium]|nr:sigma-54-dependent Fis family transcriptional regulator [Planctomycetota bacterium]